MAARKGRVFQEKEKESETKETTEKAKESDGEKAEESEDAKEVKRLTGKVTAPLRHSVMFMRFPIHQAPYTHFSLFPPFAA